MKKLKIVVLCGGLSTERYISFLSGTKICIALRRRGHMAVLADLYLGFDEEAAEDSGREPASGLLSPGVGRPFKGPGGGFDPEALFASLPPVPDYRFGGKAPDLEAVRSSRNWKSPSLFGKHVLELCRAADIVFIALHGKNGEDGRVQAAFDMLGIPYTGSGHLSASMAMDKMITKMIVGGRGVRTPAFRRWGYTPPEDGAESAAGKNQAGLREEAETDSPGDVQEDAGAQTAARDPREKFIRSVCRQTDVPCVVKTPDGGSSVGVYIVREKKQLADAVRGCMSYGNTFMVEQFIDGREFTCGVLCGRALPSVEIVPKTRFYDYSNKYAAGATEEICPGRVPPEIEREMGRIALQVHEIMGLSTYSRCDFILDREDRVWFIEVNTLPGMTNTSLVPQEAAAVGISYEELCEMIVEDALRIRGGSKWKR